MKFSSSKILSNLKNGRKRGKAEVQVLGEANSSF